MTDTIKLFEYQHDDPPPVANTDDLDTLRANAVHKVGQAQQLARRTVEAAWEAGQALRAVKEATPHGEWLPWLEAEQIARETARRFMRLADVQITQVGEFDSVDAALKALSPAPSEPSPIPIPEPEPRLFDDKPDPVDADYKVDDEDATPDDVPEPEPLPAKPKPKPAPRPRRPPAIIPQSPGMKAYLELPMEEKVRRAEEVHGVPVPNYKAATRFMGDTEDYASRLSKHTPTFVFGGLKEREVRKTMEHARVIHTWLTEYLTLS